MRYYVKCKLNSQAREKLANSIRSGNLAKGQVFYEGMHAALRGATIDDMDIVHFVEVCYCLEGGLYPMAMEAPTLREYFDSIVEVKDARFRDKCTMECEACDCTRAIKLPGKPLIEKLNLVKDVLQERKIDSTRILDIGRIVLNRRKQRQGIDALKNIVYECTSSKIKPIIAGAAISGLFAIFYDGEYFRIKNIPDTNEARQIFDKLGLSISDSVQSVKQNTKQSLAGSDAYSNIV
ncbi:MAG TPA: hypothetical protein VNB67_06500 [Nitrososphaeraceae archaeon]|jgi:hypothetical protein|nr:hypothetical protein [Nitrososphaeraceae archaeon]